MCGICGFNWDNKLKLREMLDLIKHRGPDDEGYYTDFCASIGIRRLSIIDLITGHQPQHNEKEDMWIVFNGEIYNFKDLRMDLESKGHTFYTKSDTEVIIHSYEEWGEECVKKLRGQFAFCIFDSTKKILFLARDHMGLKPLYYYFNGNKFIFSSEIKGILAHNVERELNEKGLSFYFSLRYIPFNLTLFKNILKVPPASFLIFDLESKQIKIKPYWDINFNIKRDKSVSYLANELKNLIEESIKIRLVSDVSLGAFLSGGIDSSIVVGVMSKLMDDPVKTFSIGFEEGAPTNELKYSQLVSEYYETDHTEIIVKSASLYDILPKLIWHHDDLVSDAAFVPVYLMANFTKEKMKVALTGDGADEVFAGYSVYYQADYLGFAKYVPKEIYNFLLKFYDFLPAQTLRMALTYASQSKSEEDRYMRNICRPLKEISRIIPSQTYDVPETIRKTFIENLDVINQFTRWDLKYQLPNQYNMKIDKMSMAASFEARIPFLDKEIVSWSASIPSDLKLKNNIEKYILRLAMKDMLPREILQRKKMGFGTPINLWLKTELKEVSSQLLENLQKRKNIIQSKYVKLIKKNLLKKLFADQAWNLIMFELWYETFIENDGLNPINLC
ncbi:hypothetical protein LCGC14_1051340 [marine sediment metagenome]|uniref:Glutamine amidotransferase type-2 domain-containing protein n=1 Tax=marine sediment metagenome TaxID=412755 RepID=A0A0F9MNQ3_9ZZZZ|nr:asparagine synthase (glutamine-hydrolyzing) [bacterium]